MKTEIKEGKNSQIELEVELEKDEFEPYWEKAYKQASSKLDLKGFRKGTAPKELLDAAVDKDKVFKEAIRNAARESLSQITEDKNWVIIDQPKIEVKESKVDGSLVYSAQITIFPEIKLADYEKIAKKVFSKEKEIVVEEKELQETLDYLLKSRAKETLANRAAKISDLVELNIETSSEGKAVPNGSLKRERFILGESKFIEGFDKELEGKKEKDIFNFSLQAPEDYWSSELRGKTLNFKVELLGVYEREVPKLSDEFVQSLGADFKTIEDLKKSIKEGVLAEKKHKEKQKQNIALINEIVKESKFEVPQIMIERTLNGIIADMTRFLPKEEQKKEGFEEEMRNQFQERAAQNVKQHLVMHEIAQKEKLSPSMEEIEAHAAKRGADVQQHYDQLYGELQNQKVFTFLENLAKK